MTDKNETAEKSNDTKSSYIIEEKIGNTEVPFSEVIKLYMERIVYGEGNETLFRDNDQIKLNLEEKKKFEIKDSIHRDLIYDGEIIYFPIVVSFEKDGINKIYKMFTKKYFDKIYREMNFQNPLLLIGNNYEKYNPNQILLFTYFGLKDKIYKLIEKEEENYEKYYSTNFKVSNKCVPSVFTLNFKYYFSYPKSNCKMNFCLSPERIDVMDSIIDFTNSKIHSICGPYGNGKSTSLIMLAKEYNNICYLNLRALHKYQKELYFWKFDLFLPEIYNLFKEKKDKFEEIKSIILGCNHFWETIYSSINFCIKEKMKSIFILDQYKETIDKNFNFFKKMKKIMKIIFMLN